MSSYDDKPKKFIGLGVLALIISIISAIIGIDVLISFMGNGIFGLNSDMIYAALGGAVLATVLGYIVEGLEHSDENLGSLAKSISEWITAAIVVMFIYIKFIA